MKSDITNTRVMCHYQGDRVLVIKPGFEDRAFTLVHCVFTDRHEMHLINREKKPAKPDWVMTPKLWHAVRKARVNTLNCKFELILK